MSPTALPATWLVSLLGKYVGIAGRMVSCEAVSSHPDPDARELHDRHQSLSLIASPACRSMGAVSRLVPRSGKGWLGPANRRTCLFRLPILARLLARVLLLGSRLGGVVPLVGISEGAAGRAHHDGLLPIKLDIGIVALAERAVAIAGHQMADLPQPHLTVGLGVPASCNVEIERRVRSFQHLDLQRAVMGPEIVELDEIGHAGDAAGSTPGEMLAFRYRSLPDCSIKNGLCLLLADSFHHLGIDRSDHFGLDAPLGQRRQFVIMFRRRHIPTMLTFPASAVQ